MFHALHCLQTIRTIVRESPMMQEESGGGKHEKSMAHDPDGGHGSGHDMMDPEHVAHCIGYIAQVSFEIESVSPSFGVASYNVILIFSMERRLLMLLGYCPLASALCRRQHDRASMDQTR